MTRLYLAVDLAERYSGVVMMDEKFTVVGEWTVDLGPAAKPPTPQLHLNRLRCWFYDYLALPCSLVLDTEGRVGIEDVHPFAVNIKPALRVQGALLDIMDWMDVPAELVRVLDWQKHFGYKKVQGRSSKVWAKEKCAEFGYEPAVAKTNKGRQDLRDAYLIARYLVETDTCTGLSSTQ